MMKIVDESCFSLKILSESSLHFIGIRVFIVVCIRNVKSQFQPNRAFWRLNLATGTSHEFELRANYLARLEVLSCSALAVAAPPACFTLMPFLRLANCEI